MARRIVRGYVRPEYLDEVLKRTGMLVEPIEEHMHAEVRGGIS